MDQPTLLRLVRQHADTARLFGVDFVPAYRAGAVGDPPEPSGLGGTGVLRVRADAESGPPETATEPEPEPSPPTASGATAPPSPAPPGRDRAASEAALLEVLARYKKDCPHKNFVTKFQNLVFGEGDPCARLMFIGEAPGEEEDKTGRPFVGRAGQLLEKMINAMGLKREQVYITNVLKTRPLNNATPTFEEAAACEPYLFDQIRIIRPEVIVTLGKSATQCVLKVGDSMGSLRGRWRRLEIPDGPTIPVMPTFHPAYLLRSYTPENRAKVWSDLQVVLERLGLKPPAAGAGAGKDA